MTTIQHTATSSAARQAPGQLSTSERLQADAGDSGASPLVATTAVAAAAVANAAVRTPHQPETDRDVIGRRAAGRSSAMVGAYWRAGRPASTL